MSIIVKEINFAIRFSREFGKPLYRFYSHDTWGSDNDPADPAENTGMRRAKTSQKQAITPDMQELLWSLTPKYTDNVPSVLDLCIGMPVMIKFNEATELCVTNGQNGNVVGWTFLEQDSRKYLQTLFVLLHKPSKPVKTDGLPVNVVPMTRTTTSIAVTFPDGSILEHKFKSC